MINSTSDTPTLGEQWIRQPLTIVAAALAIIVCVRYRAYEPPKTIPSRLHRTPHRRARRI